MLFAGQASVYLTLARVVKVCKRERQRNVKPENSSWRNFYNRHTTEGSALSFNLHKRKNFLVFTFFYTTKAGEREKRALKYRRSFIIKKFYDLSTSISCSLAI